MTEEKWCSFYKRLQKRERDDLVLQVCARDRKRLRRRTFKVAKLFEKSLEPLVIGTRRFEIRFPHLFRRATDRKILRPALNKFELSTLRLVIFGSATLATMNAFAVLTGFSGLGTLLSLTTLYSLPILGSWRLFRLWRRAEFAEPSFQQKLRFGLDMLLSTLAYLYTMFVSNWMRQFTDAPLVTLIAFTAMSFGAYLFSALCAWALVRLGDGFSENWVMG